MKSVESTEHLSTPYWIESFSNFQFTYEIVPETPLTILTLRIGE